MCIWDYRYYAEGKYDYFELPWFNQNNGYNVDIINKVKSLNKFETLEIEKGHIIFRVA